MRGLQVLSSLPWFASKGLIFNLRETKCSSLHFKGKPIRILKKKRETKVENKGICWFFFKKKKKWGTYPMRGSDLQRGNKEKKKPTSKK